MKVKNKRTKRYSFFALSLALCLIFASVAVSAASPTYNMSAQYKTGKYYKNFSAVNMTGDGAQDTLAIALSQLGYHEGDSNDGLDGLDLDGNRDFAEYNVLYGKLDNNQGNGVSYGYYWCASFVNWCLRQAEVSREASGAAEVSCRRWLAACKDSGIFHEKKDYIPGSADIIFFKEADSLVSSTHMGLVLWSDGKTVYTIEGNTSNGSEFSSDGNYVALKSYALTSSYIVGYATPQYNVVDGLERVDYSGNIFCAGKYISTSEIGVFSDATLTEKIGKIEAFTVFSVKNIDGDTLYLDGGCIKAENIRQITVQSDIRSLSYLNSAGKKLYPNQYATAGDTVTLTAEIPEKSTAEFLGWATWGSDTILSPGDTLTLDENVELCAIYDNTVMPIDKQTEEPTEFISLERAEVTTEEDTTESLTGEYSATGGSESSATESTGEANSDDSATDSQKNNAAPSSLRRMFGCTGSISAGYGATILIACACAKIAYRKKKK